MARAGRVPGVSTALRGLLSRHVEAGTIPGAVALLGGPDAEVVAAAVASIRNSLAADDNFVSITPARPTRWKP